MECFGVQMTSAAIPAFHAIPSEERQAAEKYGKTEGKIQYLSRFPKPKPKTSATSRNSVGTEEIPFLTLEKTIGSAISMAATIGTLLFSKIKSMRMMIEAMGVALITDTAGEKTPSKMPDAEQSEASRTPAKIPKNNPAKMRVKE